VYSNKSKDDVGTTYPLMPKPVPRFGESSAGGEVYQLWAQSWEEGKVAHDAGLLKKLVFKVPGNTAGGCYCCQCCLLLLLACCCLLACCLLACYCCRYRCIAAAAAAGFAQGGYYERPGWAGGIAGVEYANCLLMPSFEMVQKLCKDARYATREPIDIKTTVKNWGKEYCALLKDPLAATDGSWGALAQCDSTFYIMKELGSDKKAQLDGSGVQHICSCPVFGHYHWCKHVFFFSLACGTSTFPPQLDGRCSILFAVCDGAVCGSGGASGTGVGGGASGTGCVVVVVVVVVALSVWCPWWWC
jgi:hypothetical protein